MIQSQYDMLKVKRTIEQKVADYITQYSTPTAFFDAVDRYLAILEGDMRLANPTLTIVKGDLEVFFHAYGNSSRVTFLLPKHLRWAEGNRLSYLKGDITDVSFKGAEWTIIADELDNLKVS